MKLADNDIEKALIAFYEKYPSDKTFGEIALHFLGTAEYKLKKSLVSSDKFNFVGGKWRLGPKTPADRSPRHSNKKVNNIDVEKAITDYFNNGPSWSYIIDIMEELNLSRYRVKKCLENSDKFIKNSYGGWKLRPKKPETYYKGTSLTEQLIYFYVHKFFPDTVNRLLLEPKLEVDVLIPSIKVAIEYDGGHWHEKKLVKDTRRTMRLNELGYYVIRVRHAALPPMDSFNGKIIIHSGENGLHTNEFITQIIHTLADMVEDREIKQNLLNFDLSYEQQKMDTPAVYSLLYTTKISPSLADCCGAEYFDKERNAPLILENCPPFLNERKSLHIICPAGKQMLVKDFIIRPTKDTCGYPKKCSTGCYYRYCPFLLKCDDLGCEFMMNAMIQFLKKQNRDDKTNDFIEKNILDYDMWCFDQGDKGQDDYLAFLYKAANKKMSGVAMRRCVKVLEINDRLINPPKFYDCDGYRYRCVEEILLYTIISFRATGNSSHQLLHYDVEDKTRYDFLIFLRNAIEKDVINDIDDLAFLLTDMDKVSDDFACSITSILKDYLDKYELAKEHPLLGQWIK